MNGELATDQLHFQEIKRPPGSSANPPIFLFFYGFPRMDPRVELGEMAELLSGTVV